MLYTKLSIALLISAFIYTLGLTACDNSSNNSNSNHKPPTPSNKSTTKKTHFTSIKFHPLNSVLHGDFGESSAEITDYHPTSKQAFVVNAQHRRVDVLDYSNPKKPTPKPPLDITDIGDNVNSIAVHGDLLAIAIQAEVKTDNGFVAIYDANSLQRLHVVKVGVLPDMVTFTPDGNYILSANEGEPSDYRIDPEGSISIIDIRDIKRPKVRNVTFHAFNDKKQALLDAGVRIFGRLADGTASSVSQDLEPEYIAVSDDSKTAYVSLQENNALAIVDIAKAEVTDIKSFGYKDHSIKGNELDPSYKDNKINLRTFPVMGMYQPDAIACYQVNGKTYLITANEGEKRQWGNFSDAIKVSKLTLNADKFPASACGGIDCQNKKALGKLRVAKTMSNNDGGIGGDRDNKNDRYRNVLYAFGTRSFSIWNPQDMSKPVYDSGSEFAKLIAKKYPNNFNASNDDNEFESRSAKKGVEPEGIAIGKVGSQTIAFIGLERISSVVAYDVSNPIDAKFLGEINTRTFNNKLLADAKDGKRLANADGDLAPEGLHFISANDSPTKKPLLLVGYEVSGTSRLYELEFE